MGKGGNNYIGTRGGMIRNGRDALTIVTAAVILAGTGLSSVARSQDAKDATTGAAGRGVRIIAPEAPPADTVAPAQQLPTPAAVAPAPVMAAPVAPTPVQRMPATGQTPAQAPVEAPVQTQVQTQTQPQGQTSPQPAPPRPAPLPALQPCARPVAQPTLRFDDPADFDAQLRAQLKGRKTVTVDLATPYPIGREAPAPLGAWLNEVKTSGGTVAVTPYCNKGRGFGNLFASIFGGGPATPYKAARRYDAVLHVDTLDQVVTQISFAPRTRR